MKKLFLSLVALVVATMSYAQSTLVATLSHGDNITMYYGSYALRDAVNAAESGDVINLSGGAFQAVDINKAITLRGTGIDDAYPTIIFNPLTINIAENDTKYFSIEGIRCNGDINIQGTLANVIFSKNKMRNVTINTNASNALFVNCKIVNRFDIYGTSMVQFINSFVSNFENHAESSSSATFINSVIYTHQYHPGNIRSSQLVNCIICSYSDYPYKANSLPSSSVATNCVSVCLSALFNNSQINVGCKYAQYSEIFKNIVDYVTETYSDDLTFELTDEAKTKFLGTDGTEVGLYGGVMPYTSTPSYPQITKMNVANKTTADGKLSVEIEVSAAE